ncbi:hypothetical protein K2Q16_00735 [Patescibacteria group bacterium]|nr:hypothetical protein [Patescibacteria group bacterium]
MNDERKKEQLGDLIIFGQRADVSGPVGESAATESVTLAEAGVESQEPHLYMLPGPAVPDGLDSGFLSDREGICGGPDD